MTWREGRRVAPRVGWTVGGLWANWCRIVGLIAKWRGCECGALREWRSSEGEGFRSRIVVHVVVVAWLMLVNSEILKGLIESKLSGYKEES